MRSPVKTGHFIFGVEPKDKQFAGLSALSQYSMIAPPIVPTYAIDALTWKKFSSKGQIIPYSEGATAELEVWRYDPKLFQQNQTVDPFSLYLSLKDVTDERVEYALTEMLEQFL